MLSYTKKIFLTFHVFESSWWYFHNHFTSYNQTFFPLFSPSFLLQPNFVWLCIIMGSSSQKRRLQHLQRLFHHLAYLTEQAVWIRLTVGMTVVIWIFSHNTFLSVKAEYNMYCVLRL